MARRIPPLETFLSESHGFQLTSRSPYFHRSYSGLTPFAANNKVSPYAQDQWDHHYHRGPGDQQGKMRNIMNMLRQSGELDGILDYRADMRELKELYLQRTHWDAANMRLDVFIRLRMDEAGEFWGVIRHFDKPAKRKMESELLRDNRLSVTREFALQLQGVIVDSLLEWYRPQKGHYNVMSDIVARDWFGKPVVLKKGARVAVKSVDSWWQGEPVIHLESGETALSVESPDYWFWRYRCDKTD